MSKTGNNYIKKELKINTDNFGFSFSHHNNKSANFFSMNQKENTNPQFNTNNNINNQFNNNNINIINININSNNNSNINSNNISNINNKKTYNKNSNTNINIINREKAKNPYINIIKQKINLNSNFNKQYNNDQKSKLETNPNDLNYNKNNKNILKDENISYSTSRPETEIISMKNSGKLNNSKKDNLLQVETPKQMIISYSDVKNLLAKKNLKFEFQKKRIPQTEKSQNIKEKFNDINKEKYKIIRNNYTNMNDFKNIKHQSEENLLKFSNKYIYYNKNIKQSKSFLNKNQFNNIKNNFNNNNNEINSLGHLKTSGNMQIDIKNIKRYYRKNDELNIDKSKNYTDKFENKNIINDNMLQSPSINLSNKSQKFSNSYYFQKFIYKKNNGDTDKNNINISNIKKSINNSNNEINNLNFNNINKQKNSKLNSYEPKKTIKEYTIYHAALSPEKNKDKKDILSLEDYFNNELEINNFKNPEELHYLYIKIFQTGKEISQNFENNE